MPNSGDDDPLRDDPYLQVFAAIGTELSLIRQELQRMNADPEPEDVEEFECRCGTVIAGERQARRHATDDHGAPDAAWREMYA